MWLRHLWHGWQRLRGDTNYPLVYLPQDPAADAPDSSHLRSGNGESKAARPETEAPDPELKEKT